MSRGLVMSTLSPLIEKQQAVAGETEHVVERQGRDHYLRAGLDELSPEHADLSEVRDHVAVREHRTLRRSSRSAGVLQECQVVRADRRRREARGRPAGERLPQAHRLWKIESRHHALDVPGEEVDGGTPGQRRKIREPCGEDVPDGGVCDDLRQYVSEVLQDHDRARARIDQLMMQLPRRIERIGVHDREPRTQRAEDRHRVLEQVRHHERHAFPGSEADLEEVGGEPAGKALEIRKGQRHSEVVISGAIGKSRAARIENADQRRLGTDLDARLAQS